MKIAKKILAGTLALMSTFTVVSAEPENKENLLENSTNVENKKGENNEKLKSKMNPFGKVLTVGAVAGILAGAVVEFFKRDTRYVESVYNFILYCSSIPKVRNSIMYFIYELKRKRTRSEELFVCLFKSLHNSDDFFDKFNCKSTKYRENMEKLLVSYSLDYRFCEGFYNLEKTIHGIFECEDLEKIIVDSIKKYVHSEKVNTQHWYCEIYKMDTIKDVISIYLKTDLLIGPYGHTNHQYSISGISKDGKKASYELKSVILYGDDENGNSVASVYSRIEGSNKWIECGSLDEICDDNLFSTACSYYKNVHLIYQI